jgi:O-antigen ligase
VLLQRSIVVAPGAIARGVFVLWALGTLRSEGLQQAALYAILLIALGLLAQRRLALPAEVKAVALAGALLFAWQALSPLVARATGASPGWPRFSRYGQAPEALAVGAVAAVAALGVPWRALQWILGAGWAAHGAAALFQFLVPWPFGAMGPLHLPLARLQENFGPEGGPVRHAGLGLFFHRLRLAHGAVAVLGPALSAVSGAAPRGQRGRWLLFAAVLLGCVYLSYARAALGAAVAAVLLSAVFALRGPMRALAVSVMVLAGTGAGFSPGWRQRASRAQGYLDPERKITLKTGFEIACSHPFLGVGFGNYRPAALRVQAALERDKGDEIPAILANDAHNFFLTVWAETGALGVGLTLAFHALLARAFYRRARGGQRWAMAGLFSQAGFHLLGLVHYVPYHSGVHLSFCLVWGLSLAPRLDNTGTPWV